MLTNLHFSRIAYNFVGCVNKGRRQKRGNFVWYIPQNRRTLPLPLSQLWFNNRVNRYRGLTKGNS